MWLLGLAIAVAPWCPGCRDGTTFPEQSLLGLTGRAECQFAFAALHRKMLF